MSLEAAGRFLAVLTLAGAASAVLAQLAPRLGWTDAPRAGDAARKRQGRAVPAIGGAALLIGLLAAPESLLGPRPGELWGRWLPGTGWSLASLALVFAAGSWDDRRGLSPGKKVLAQLAALAPLLAGSFLEHGLAAALVLGLIGLALLNLLNTYDNADGALASLGALGFLAAAPSVAAACLGFLPWNLDASRSRNRASRAPSAYLGDAGAFVLGFLLLLTPRAAGLLVLPTLDLVRLSWARLRRGSRPWIGDRGHLAHRLEARGLARPLVALALCAAAWPACGLCARAFTTGSTSVAWLGVLASTGLYLLLLVLSRVRAAGASSCDGLPCPGERSSE